MSGDDDATFRRLNEQAYQITQELHRVIVAAREAAGGQPYDDDVVTSIPGFYIEAVDALFEASQDIHSHVEDSDPVWDIDANEVMV